MHDVGTVDHADEHVADHDGVGGRVAVLEEMGASSQARPAATRSSCATKSHTFHSSKEMAIGRVGSGLRFDLANGVGDRGDEAVHGYAGGEEGGEVAVVAKVLVAGDVINVFDGVQEHLLLPRAERGHSVIGTSAYDEFEIGVEGAHGCGGACGKAAVLVGAEVADLPGAVHLVADAPEPNVVGLFCAVCAPLVRQCRPRGVVRVLEEP